MKLTDQEWKAKLTPAQYKVLREKGTETPFSGEFTDNTSTGMYTCAACGNLLFSSEHKFEAASPGLMGWPSFYDIADTGAVNLVEDKSFGMNRVEVQCAKCGGHLGHVFEEATDQPDGKHYCINSTCLAFDPKTPNL